MSEQMNLSKVYPLLETAQRNHQQTLSEAQSKQILADYGIPVIENALVQTAEEAVSFAETIGYPVAIKGCAPNLPHKSDRGLVRLNISSSAEIHRAIQEIRQTSLDTPLDGYLVQRMAHSRREIIAGGMRDPLFGPCVLLGIGGIAVEAFGDVTFRMAPLEAHDLDQMIQELKGHKIFDTFRDEPLVDRRALLDILQAIGQILIDCPPIGQIDINPLLLENGRPIAVDALISLQCAEAAAPAAVTRAPDRKWFLNLFEPESLAIIGVSDSPLKWGYRILFNTLDGGYSGRLYAVNPKYPSLLGVPCYPSISAIPETVDLAMLVVPPPAVLPTLHECAQKGVKAALIITAGFGELNDEEAKSAQRQLAEFAQTSRMLVIGPNCAGVASPAPYHLYSGMISRFPGPGGLSIVSQSGNVGATILTWANVHQVGIARFISTGNEAAVRTADYFDFLAEDPKTTAIISYIENTRDGLLLFEALRNANARKPVVLIRGGRSHAGMKAAQSHTGALASETRIFQAICRQAGVCLVDDVYEAMEIAAVLMRQPRPKGRRVAIVSQGGGWGVIGADACAEAGLEVVSLPEDTLAELDAILPDWWSRNNPIDLVAGTNLDSIPRTVETVMQCPDVDAVILLGIGYIASAAARYEKSEKARDIGLDKLAEMGMQIECNDVQRMADMIQTYQKPLLVASDTALIAYGARPNEAIAQLEQRGIYVFASPTRVARALARLTERAYLQPGNV